MNESKLNNTLDILRLLWKEGTELSNKISKGNEENYSSEYYHWNAKAESFLKHLFYNSTFLEEFKQLDIFDYDYQGNRESLEIGNTIGGKLGYIESHGQLLKRGEIPLLL